MMKSSLPFRPEKFILGILGVLVLLPAVLAQEVASPGLLHLDSTVVVQVKGEDSGGGKVDQTEGGLRITYSNTKENTPTVWIYKTLKSPAEATRLTFDVRGESDLRGQVHVYNTEYKATGKPFKTGEVEMDLGTAKFNSSEDLFSGRVKQIAILIWLDGGVGEHSLEIKGLSVQ
ncbi:MAG: hypothetical protein WC003_02245 [Terrimicrobiaceae bacterium]